MISQLRRGVLLFGAMLSVSTAAFCQTPTLLMPDGGEQFTEGDIVPILWTGTDAADRVTLEYSVNGGASWLPISGTAAGGRFLWKVPSLSGISCLVRVSKVTSTGTLLYSVPKEGALPNGSIFTPDGAYLIIITQDGNVRVSRAADGALVKNFRAHEGSIIRVDVSDDGSNIATASLDGTVKVWSTSNWSLIRTFTPSPPEGSYQARFSPSGAELVVGYTDGRIRVWNINTGVARLDFLSATAGFPRGIDYSRDGMLLLAAGSDGVGRAFSAADGRLMFTMTGHSREINSIRSSPDGSLIATGSFDGTARLWSATDGAFIRAFIGHGSDVYSVKFDPSGTRIVTASSDRTVRVWSVSDGTLLTTLEGHTGPVVRAIFSSDGEKVASASTDGTVKVWSLVGVRSDQSAEPFSIVSCSLSAVGRDTDGEKGKKADHVDLR